MLFINYHCNYQLHTTLPIDHLGYICYIGLQTFLIFLSFVIIWHMRCGEKNANLQGASLALDSPLKAYLSDIDKILTYIVSGLFLCPIGFRTIIFLVFSQQGDVILFAYRFSFKGPRFYAFSPLYSCLCILGGCELTKDRPTRFFENYRYLRYSHANTKLCAEQVFFTYNYFIISMNTWITLIII